MWDKIHHFASFPQTGGELYSSWLWVHHSRSGRRSLVSLQQMVQFGQNPSQGTLLRASQFLLGAYCCTTFNHSPYCLPPRSEELPVRLAHRAKELDELPHNLSNMPSIQKVKNWYAQSFEVRSYIPFLRSDALSPLRLITSLLGIDQFPSHLSPAGYPRRTKPRGYLTPRIDAKPIL